MFVVAWAQYSLAFGSVRHCKLLVLHNVMILLVYGLALWIRLALILMVDMRFDVVGHLSWWHPHEASSRGHDGMWVLGSPTLISLISLGSDRCSVSFLVLGLREARRYKWLQ
ncbi:hypothetical protein GOP47_0002223 [Adiantum capillus-veneris]|uniref:Uncharacterized protein n=1 Tax=Adiantum capillus-veneris TaxID=13818 RepID=A0A9D4ZRF8_ADICA|nr:hypothetical protein GOP47_0002223 [Adiantum capillus-veneris]